MEAGVFALQIIYLQFLDRLDGLGRDNMEFMVKSCKFLQDIEKECGGCPEQVCGLAGDDPSVVQFQGSGRTARLLRALQRFYCDFPVSGSDPRHVHEQFDLLCLFIGGISFEERI